MKLKDSIVISEIEDGYIIIDSKLDKERFNGMVKLNDTSKRIVEVFKSEHSILEATDILYNIYDVDKNILMKDIETIVDKLKELNYFED